jgi:undecaprenyl-diphosphatase
MENETVLELDRNLFFAVYGGASPGAAALVMIALTVLGSGWSMLALVPLFVMERTRRFAGALVLTLILTSAIVFALKHAVARVRPLHALAGVRALFDAPTDFSFPSGHAAGSFAFAAFVATVLLAAPRLRAAPLMVLGLFVLAAGVAVSRVYLGAHFPGDVTAGALVGGLVGAVAGRVYTSRGVVGAPVTT